MNDPLVLLLFLATWGGVVLLFSRLADDFRKATVRQSDKPAQIDEELLRITSEVQETVEGLGEAMGKRADQLRNLIAEADSKIAALQAVVAAPQRAEDAVPGGVGGRASAASEAPANSARGPRGSAASPWPAEPQPAPSGTRASATEVLRLAAEGTPIQEIARLTNRGREEVRLLLGTRH